MYIEYMFCAHQWIERLLKFRFAAEPYRYITDRRIGKRQLIGHDLYNKNYIYDEKHSDKFISPTR